MLRCEALLSWCGNTLGQASVPHEVPAAVLGSIVRYAASYLSDSTVAVVRRSAELKAAALSFDGYLMAHRRDCRHQNLSLPQTPCP